MMVMPMAEGKGEGTLCNEAIWLLPVMLCLCASVVTSGGGCASCRFYLCRVLLYRTVPVPVPVPVLSVSNRFFEKRDTF